MTDHVHGGGGGGGSVADPSLLGTAAALSTSATEYALGEDIESGALYEIWVLSANGNAPLMVTGYALLNLVTAVATAPTSTAQSINLRLPRLNGTSITASNPESLRVWVKDASSLWFATWRGDTGTTVAVYKVPR